MGLRFRRFIFGMVLVLEIFLFLFSTKIVKADDRPTRAQDLKFTWETTEAEPNQEHGAEKEEISWFIPAAATRFYVNWFRDPEKLKVLPNPLFRVVKNDGKTIQINIGNFDAVKKRIKASLGRRFLTLVKAAAGKVGDMAGMPLFEKDVKTLSDNLFLTQENTNVPDKFWEKDENHVFYKVYYNGTFLLKGVGGPQISVDTPSSGNYKFYVYEISSAYFQGNARMDEDTDIGKIDGREPLWVQTIQVDARDGILSEEEQDILAKRFSPILSLADAEKYYPTSRGYIANVIDKDEQLDKIPVFFQLPHQKKFIAVQYKDALATLLNFGSDNLVVDTKSVTEFFNRIPFTNVQLYPTPALPRLISKRYGAKHAAVHYKFIESTETVNLHFEQFFTYDPKTGTEERPNAASHLFDRESSTVTFSKEEIRTAIKNKTLDNVLPKTVTYGSHLDKQKKSLLNEVPGKLAEFNKAIFTWDTEGAKLNWEDAPKVGSHPIFFLALGSHGNYPYMATGHRGYNIEMVGANTLFEIAGGSNLLIPREISEIVKRGRKTLKLTEYELIRLQVDENSIPNSQVVDGLAGANCENTFATTRQASCEYVKKAPLFNIESLPAAADESEDLVKAIWSLIL